MQILPHVFSSLTTRVRRCRQDVIEVSYDGAPLGEPSDVTFPGVLRHEDGAESKYQVGDAVVWSWSMPAAWGTVEKEPLGVNLFRFCLRF